MICVSAPTILGAWLCGVESLMSAHGDAFTSIVNVESPCEPHGRDANARSLLDDFMLRHCKRKDTQYVANTIFPDAMASSRDAETLYRDYVQRTYPRIRRQPGNGKGTYFLRLIEYQTPSDESAKSANQLAQTIRKMQQSLSRRGGMRNVYELSVYHPGDDARNQRGFPCLSHISAKLDITHKVVHLTALYRNQMYIERLYGNLLGLSRLQAFIGREIGFGQGNLTCHATHAELDVAASHVRPLLASIRASLVATEVPVLTSRAIF